MENIKTLIKEMETSMQEAMELLWDVETNYRDVHHVMNILRDGSPIVKNPEGAMLKLAIERYFEKHEAETDQNDVKKVIKDIVDVKLKMIQLQEIITYEESLKSEKISFLEKQTSDVQKAMNEIQKKLEEKPIELRPTPVREDLFKPRIDASLIGGWMSHQELTIEEWAEIRGPVINKIDGTSIRTHVVDAVKDDMDKGLAHIFNTVIPKYYPNAKRISQAVYTRSYYKHLGKKAIIPEEWIEQEQTKETTPAITKIQNGKSARDVQPIDFTGQLSDELYEKYECRPNAKNLAIVLDTLTKHDRATRQEITKLSGVNDNRTYTHLRYASRSNYVNLDKRKYSINEQGRQELNRLLGQETKIEETEKAIEETTASESKKKSRKIRGRKITSKIAQRINKTYSTVLTFNRYEEILKAIYKNPGKDEKEYAKMIGIHVSPVYAHLRFGVEIGDIEAKHEQYTLRENGIGKAEKLFKEVTPKQTKETVIETTKETTKMQKKSLPKASAKFNEKYGEKIDDEIAREIEERFHYSIRVPTMNQILEDVKQNPGTSIKDIASRTGLLQVKTNAHMQYGIRTDKIFAKGTRYYGVEGNTTVKAPNKKEKTKKLKTPKVQLEGTPLTDNTAQNIHIKYGSPVIKERYEKIKNILENAILYKSTVSQISEQTGWSKYSIYIHMLYGCHKNIGEIINLGEEDGKMQYCLKKNKGKVVAPKETVIKSKSWLKPKDDSESLWKKP